ncbi:MAG: M20/M25/M40 family metallo-hydrolase [Chloroflexi bacterium]|nr:M20/M25/M40 family metallo-hydrolase [Chloroflexota bacterium]
MTATSLTAALDYAREHHADFLDGFRTLLRFPSISLERARQADLLACAEWIAVQMRQAGLDNAQLLPTPGNPIVYGDWLHADAAKPTILLYAHYDVQPIGDAALWHSPPFQPTVVKGRLIARGAVDDKCGVWILLKALEAILAAGGRLPVNVKCLFEGEEELGSKNTIAALNQYRSLLAADALIICDGPFSPKQPGIGVSVRGAVQGELRVTGPPQDLHSGRYGGAVRNPIHSLARIIAALHDSEGRVRLPGFYDQLPQSPVNQWCGMAGARPMQAPAIMPDANADLQKAAGLDDFFGEALGSFAVRTTMLPTLDVGGIFGGYSGEGLRAIIPSEAGCKLTLRTVPGQDGAERWASLVEHAKSFREPGIDIEARLHSIAHPFAMAADGREALALRRALESTLGMPARLLRHGGSLAIGGVLARLLNAPVSMLGLGSGGNSHAANEYIVLDDIAPALEVAIRALFELGNEG